MATKIGVIGPPGTGKTKFANALRRWDGWDEYEQPVLIDHYVTRLQRDTGLALGPWASYAENMMVAGERMRLEARQSNIPTITVGTIVDTLMYTLMHADVMLHRTGIDRQSAYLQAQTAIQAMTMWYTELWDYHLAFFLPFHSHQHSLDWTMEYSTMMPDVLATYGVPGVVTLPAAPLDDQIKLAKEVIELARAEEKSGATVQLPQVEER